MQQTAKVFPPPQYLLQHLPTHRVLICKACRYAIQPSAIPRHLKEQHNLPLAQRLTYIEYADALNLAVLDDVVYPEPHEYPVPFLPIETGQACGAIGCSYLCASVKRMKNHWLKEHRDDEPEPIWSSVNLQTFFRGNQLRYFIVRQEDNTVLQPNKIVPNHDISSLEPSKSASFDWNEIDLLLLDHFQNTVYRTLGYAKNIGVVLSLWQTTIPALACSHSFLKHCMLACSALHLGYLNPLEKERYTNIATSFQRKALQQAHAAASAPSELNCDALFAFSHLLLVYNSATDADNGGSLTGLFTQFRLIHKKLKPLWQQIEKGPLSSLAPEGMNSQNLAPLEVDPERLRHLMMVPFFGSNPLIYKFASGDVSPAPPALFELSWAFQRAKAAHKSSGFTLWTAVLIWPVRIADLFLQHLEEKEQACLIILAHYLILLEPLDLCWYMCGYRQRMISRIRDGLDDEYRLFCSCLAKTT